MMNNPGNLRPVGSQTGFQQFDSPDAGLAAMQQDLLAKISGNSNAMKARYGANYQPTINSVISTYAPSSENNTANYINFVAKNSGLDPNQPLAPSDVTRIMPPMLKMEGSNVQMPQTTSQDTLIGSGSPSKIELILEADKRGILPPDKKALLDEAKSRGLIKDSAGSTADSIVQPFMDTFAGGVDSAKNVGRLLTGQPTQNYTPDLNALKAGADQAPEGAGFIDRAKSAWANTSGPQIAGAAEEALMTSPPGQIASAVAGTVGNIPTTLIGMANQKAEQSLGIPHQYSQAAEMLLPFGAKKIGGMLKPAVESAPGTFMDLMRDNNNGPPPPPGAPPALPQELSNLSMLPAAAKGTTFAKAPNPIDAGLKANQAISQQYGQDLSTLQSHYKTLNGLGNIFSVKAPELYGKLDGIINYLSDKVAPGSKEHLALSNLIDIRDNLSEKYSVNSKPPQDTGIINPNGEPIIKPGVKGVEAYGINPSDLVDIKTAINSGLNTNRFVTSGGGKLLAFKSYVNDALKNASDLSPEFGKALNTAEKQAARVGQYKSSQLKPLWQPEDYVAWKAAQNDPTNAGVSASTLSRANEFLDNLNSDKAGRASILSTLLPPEMAKQVLRQAIIHGRRTTPNFASAGMQLAGGSPIGALKTLGASVMNPQEVPLLELSKNLKKMGAK